MAHLWTQGDEPVNDRHDLSPPESNAEDPGSAATDSGDELDYGLAAAFEESGRWGAGPPPSVLGSFDSTAALLGRLCLQSAHPDEVEPLPHVRSHEVPTGPTGRYQIHGEISRGGMGAVLRARDGDLGRDLAVKVLLSQHMQRPEMFERFIEEAQIGGQLQHPGILPVHELGRFADGRPYFTMKFVRGRTLEALLATRRSVAEDRARFVGIFEQICHTIAYAHASGVVHRDLKPANIMVGSFGEVQVMDWGLAKVLIEGESKETREHASTDEVPVVRTARSDAAGGGGTTERSATQAGSVLGTPAYMAPEQARGEVHRIDERTDVFGLGAILAEILTGEPPFSGDPKSAHAMSRVGDLSGAHARLEGCGADTVLIELSKRCLAAEPGDRPRTGGDVAEAVAEHLESVEKRLRQTELERTAERARAKEAQGRALAERRARHRTVALAATVLVAFTIGSVVWLTVEKRESARLARLSGEIHVALENAVTEREKARAASPGDLAAWNSARSEAERARALAGGESIDGGLRARIERIRSEIASDDRDRKFAAELERIYREEVSETLERTASKYRLAFARYGIDVPRSTPEETIASISGRPERVREALIMAFDHWLDRVRDDTEAESAWLRTVLSAVDKSEWRRAVRAADSLEELEALAEREEEALQQPPATLVRLGRALIEADAIDRAVELLRPAQALHPGDYWVNTTLAAALRRKNSPDAVWHDRIALALRPDGDSYRRLAHELARQGNFADAAKNYETALRLNPESAEIHYDFGNALYRRGDLEAAITRYEKAIELDPEFAWAYVNLGAAREAQGDFASAARHCRKAIGLKPDYVRAYVNLGTALHRQGEFTEAIRSYETALRLDPSSAEAHIGLGEARQSLGKVGQAIESYERAIELNSNSEWAHLNLGNALQEQGDIDGAIRIFKTAIKLNPELADSYYNLANALKIKKEFAAAVEQYERAIELNPRFVNAIINLGNVLTDQGDVSAAIQQYTKASELDPHHAVPHFNLGNIYLVERHWQRAIEHFRKSVQLDSNYSDAHLGLANALLTQGELAAAIEHYQKVLELRPNDPQACYGLGNVLRSQGDFSAAVDYYNNAIEVAPKFAEAHCNLGATLAAQGKFSESLDCIRKGHEFGSQRPDWPYPSAQWVTRAERQAALEVQLEELLFGKLAAESAEELLEYRAICYAKKRFAAAARLDIEAFERKPDLAADFLRGHRYNAACDAALAATGAGTDSSSLDDARRAHLRARALEWLQADIESWRANNQNDNPSVQNRLTAVMAHWKRGSDLAGVRELDSLKALPESEAVLWRELWRKVDELSAVVEEAETRQR